MRIPFFDQIEESKTVLLAGAGGGFDIFSGLPIYFWLKSQGKTVHLANLSFTELDCCAGERPGPALMRVTPDASGLVSYFPELYLSQWLSDRYGETPVYAIERVGAKPIGDAYSWMAETLKPDTLILVDGGVDSLMRGDEAGLGTPQEDMASLSAGYSVTGIENKFLVAIGFGVDTHHGVSHGQFLENVAALSEAGGYLGAWSLMAGSEEFSLYTEAIDFVVRRMPQRPSIVNASIISAVNGWFGDRHATKRTEGTTLFINPLMGLYWSFALEKVAKRNLYLNHIRQTETFADLALSIEAFRASLPRARPWIEIPC